MSIRVVLVDDHKILRDALKGVLEREHDITLVGETSEGSEVLELARESHPGVASLMSSQSHIPFGRSFSCWM